MSETPTPKQALILWSLLGRCGSAPQSTLVPRVGKADREALVAGRFIQAERQGRSQRLTVTDRGWDWASGHMREPLPPSFRGLQDWLERVQAHLETTGVTLAEFIGPMPEEPAQEKLPAAQRKPRARKPAGPKSPTPKQLRARIERAYLDLTGGERATAVRLSALRGKLGDLDRETVDAGLAAILKGDPKARLSQFSDPKSLDAAERAAAYAPAGEPFHILWIQS